MLTNFVYNLVNMATIKFLLQSDKPEAPIYCRLSAGRELTIKRKTGFTIDPVDWDTKQGKAKGKDARAKALNHQLSKLDEYIFEAYNKAQASGLKIDGDWLQTQINAAFDREEPSDREKKIEGIVEYGRYFLDNLDFKVTDRGKKGASSWEIMLIRERSLTPFVGFSSALRNLKFF